ncbi:MAG: hypothetical protein WCP09_03360 [Candidatus Taylorbacteria bacterium]
MKYLKNIESLKRSMDNKWKIIGIGSGALVIVIIVIYLIMGKASGESESLIKLGAKSPVSNVALVNMPVGDGEYTVEEAVDHIGENATVVGTISRIFTSKSGTAFLDFCENFQTCPFTAVIFASDAAKFKNLDQYKREVRLTGLIKSYQGKAEIILNGPEQIE